MLINPQINISSRESTYLIKSRTGIYTFRWNIKIDGKHKQPRISLRTRNYLVAIKHASVLATEILSIRNPTVNEVKKVYDKYSGKAVNKILITSLDITESLSELSASSRNEYLSCFRNFQKVIDGKDLGKDQLKQENIEAYKATQTCSPVTLKKKLRLLSACFKRADVFFDIEWMQVVVKGKTPKSKRRSFTDKERDKILTNTKSDKGWKYYLPRIALLTGCRLNEIAQLRVSDIVLGESPYLSINADGDDKRLKNEASHRDIPLSKALYKLLSPLLKAKTGNELLFNDLPYGVDNGYNSKPSKYFSKMCKSLVFKDVSFHSFRHYVITKLFNAGVKEELIGSLMGHSVGKLTTGKVYLSGFTYQNKLEAISLL